MSAPGGLWVITADAAAAKAVAQAVAPHPQIKLLGVRPQMSDLAQALEQPAACLAVIDIDAGPRAILADLEKLALRFSHARFVVISQRLDQQLLLEAMQAGARNFITRNALAAELPPVLLRLISGLPQSTTQRGNVVSVMSSGGGCGCTTIAINLANELNLIRPGPTLLIDLDVAYGGIGQYLGLKGQFGVADVLRSASIDANLVTSTAIPHQDRLQVLLSPATLTRESGSPLPDARLTDMLDVCRQLFQWTVIDAPRLPRGQNGQLASVSNFSLVVFQLAVKDIRWARELLESLVEQGVPAQGIMALANRYRRGRPLVPLDEARRALGNFQIETISNDFRVALEAFNLGHLLADAAPRSSLREDIRQLARLLDQMQTQAPMTHLSTRTA